MSSPAAILDLENTLSKELRCQVVKYWIELAFELLSEYIITNWDRDRQNIFFNHK